MGKGGTERRGEHSHAETREATLSLKSAATAAARGWQLEGPKFEWQRNDTALRHATSTRESGIRAWLQRCSPLSVLPNGQQPYQAKIIHSTRSTIGNQPFVH